jgi:hypothetical protein
VTKSRLAQLFSILRTSMPTQRDSRLRVDERRCRRVLLLSAACSSRESLAFVPWRGATNRHKVASLLPTQSRGLDRLYSLSLFTGSLQDLQRPYLHGVPHSNTNTGRSCWHGRNSLFCKSAYLHVRRHLYCLVTTCAATPVLSCHDARNATCILNF